MSQSDMYGTEHAGGRCWPRAVGMAWLIGLGSALCGFVCTLAATLVIQLPVGWLADYERWWNELELAMQLGTVAGVCAAWTLSVLGLRKLRLANPVRAGLAGSLVTSAAITAEISVAEDIDVYGDGIPTVVVVGAMVISVLVVYAVIALLAPYRWALTVLAVAGAVGMGMLMLSGEIF